MPTASIAFSNRSRSSSKCETRVPSASSSVRLRAHSLGGLPASAAAGGGSVGCGGAMVGGFVGWNGAAGARLVLLFQQLFRADLAFQLLAQLARHRARSSQPVADLARDFGQALWPQHDQSDGRGEQDLRKSNIKHATSRVRFWRRLDFGLAGGCTRFEIGVLVLLELLDLLLGFTFMHRLLEALDGPRPDRSRSNAIAWCRISPEQWPK